MTPLPNDGANRDKMSGRSISSFASRVPTKMAGRAAEDVPVVVPMPRLLTVRDVADWLTTTRAAVYAMVERGQIPVVRIGRSVRFDQVALVEWLRHKSIAVTCERAA